MVDRIQKTLNKMSVKEKNQILNLVHDIEQGNGSKYDIKKLKGHSNMYRVRWGKWRIMYVVEDNKTVRVSSIERRSDTTYNYL